MVQAAGCIVVDQMPWLLDPGLASTLNTTGIVGSHRRSTNGDHNPTTLPLLLLDSHKIWTGPGDRLAPVSRRIIFATGDTITVNVTNNWTLHAFSIRAWGHHPCHQPGHTGPKNSKRPGAPISSTTT
jgi:hypothetical protein